MRKLHFVGVSDDGAHLLLQDATNVREQFLLPIDERVRAASRGDRSRLGQIEIELESTLRPREIQARIRAGESPEEVAAAANAPLQRVMRFAYPVLQEREQVTVEARRTRIRRSDGALQLGEQVDDRLTRQGIDPETADWDAYRREDGTWWLSLSWMAGKTPRRAQWSFDLAGRTLTPADDLAAELQAEQPRRRPIAAVPFVPDDEPDEEPEEAPAPRPAERWSEQRTRPAREESRTEPDRPRENRREEPAERRETNSTARREANTSARPETSTNDRRENSSTARRESSSNNRQTGSNARRESSSNDRRETARTPDRPANGTNRTEPSRPAKADRGSRSLESARAKSRLEPERLSRPSSEPYGWAAPAADEDEPRTAVPAPANEPVKDEPAAAGRSTESTESEAAEPDTRKSGRSRKPKVPSWDDIVFGTRSQR